MSLRKNFMSYYNERITLTYTPNNHRNLCGICKRLNTTPEDPESST